MRARSCPPHKSDTVEPYLGDMRDMEAVPAVFRRAPPHDDYHWMKRGGVVVAGVLAVWFGLMWWAAN